MHTLLDMPWKPGKVGPIVTFTRHGPLPLQWSSYCGFITAATEDGHILVAGPRHLFLRGHIRGFTATHADTREELIFIDGPWFVGNYDLFFALYYMPHGSQQLATFSRNGFVHPDTQTSITLCHSSLHGIQYIHSKKVELQPVWFMWDWESGSEPISGWTENSTIASANDSHIVLSPVSCAEGCSGSPAWNTSGELIGSVAATTRIGQQPTGHVILVPAHVITGHTAELIEQLG